VFSQGDLKANCSYILDSGSVAVFVWHGARSSARARQLAVRCAKAYVGTTLMGVDTVSAADTAAALFTRRMCSLSVCQHYRVTMDCCDRTVLMAYC
jgi:Gelsolin repeat